MSTKNPKPSKSNTVAPDKWAALRIKERIVRADYKSLPHINSTMRAPYFGAELTYRGCPTPCPSS